MPEPNLDPDAPVSDAQQGLLEQFEREAAQVFPELGEPEPSDAALFERMADHAIESTPASAGADASASATTSGKLLAGLGLTVVAGVIVAAMLVGSRTEPRAPQPSQAATQVSPPTPPPAPEPIVVEEGTPAVIEPSALVEPESEPEPAPAPAPALAREAPPRGDAHAKARPAPEPEPEPELSARDLLEAANAARRTGDHPKARAGYERLAREFPGTREDMIGRVSLGKLLLERLGDPGGALAHFDAYLKENTNGNLAEEALYGRARALRRLGRGGEERAAWAELSRRFPSSVHAAEARERQADEGG